MTKLQELFKRPDGSKILDVKLFANIVDLPSAPVEKETPKGTTISVFPVKMSHQGQTYEWELSAAQVARIFTKTDRNSNAVTWQGRTGDNVYVWYAKAKTPGGYDYFAVEPANDIDTVAAAMEAFADDGEMKPTIAANPVAVADKPRFVKTTRSGAADDTKWDGTPRQGNFRAGLAGIFQSILSNPNVDPFDEAQRNNAFELAQKLMLSVRYAAKTLEASTQD